VKIIKGEEEDGTGLMVLQRWLDWRRDVCYQFQLEYSAAPHDEGRSTGDEDRLRDNKRSGGSTLPFGVLRAASDVERLTAAPSLSRGGSGENLDPVRLDDDLWRGACGGGAGH
jgi:hypothetical protein